MRNPHICPNCGAQATAFAAGCSICGQPLDPRRAQGRPTPWRRLRSSWLARPRARGRVRVPRTG